MSHPPPDTLPLLHETEALLQTERLGRALRGYRNVGSTNTVAMAWAADGAPEGGVVLADYQTAGRGRQGRSWLSQSGRNLMVSIILRPALSPARLSLIPLAASVAVAEAIEAMGAPLHAAVKWPNDVLLDGRKCSGMLLESTLGEAKGTTVVLGIGINVNQETFPEELADWATSLRLEAGRPLPRAPLLADLLLRLERHYDALGTPAEGNVRAAYTERLQGLGHPLTLRFADAQTYVSGTFVGVTDTGALRLQTDTGLQTFHAGEVTSHLEIRRSNFQK